MGDIIVGDYVQHSKGRGTVESFAADGDVFIRGPPGDVEFKGDADEDAIFMESSNTVKVARRDIKLLVPCMVSLLNLDHTTLESEGFQNCFIHSLNVMHPGESTNILPVFSHDQKDNFEATKVVANIPISSFNQILEQKPTVTLRVNPLDQDPSPLSYDEK